MQQDFAQARQSRQEDMKPRLWTIPFLSLTVAMLLLFLNLQMLLAPFPAYVKSEFQAGDLEASMVVTLFALSAIVARFLTAALMRTTSHALLLVAGLAIAAATTGVYALAESMPSLYAMRIGYGIGFGMASTVMPTLVSAIIPPRRMGEGIGYFGLSTSVAMSVGPIIGLNVMKHGNFAALSLLGTVTALVAVPVLALSGVLKQASRKRTSPVPADGQAAGRKRLSGKLLFPVLLNVLLAVTYSGLLSFLALFGEFVHLEQVGLFFLFNVVAILIVRPISGRLFDKKGPAAVLVPAAFMVVVSMALLSYAHTMWMLVLSALCYGAGFGAIQPTVQAWMLRLSTPEQYGTANSLFYNSTDFGVAIGAVILGAISSATDYSVMYRYSAAFMVAFLALCWAFKPRLSVQSGAQGT